MRKAALMFCARLGALRLKKYASIADDVKPASMDEPQCIGPTEHDDARVAPQVVGKELDEILEIIERHKNWFVTSGQATFPPGAGCPRAESQTSFRTTRGSSGSTHRGR